MRAFDRTLLQAFIALAAVIASLLFISSTHAQEIAPERNAFVAAAQKQRAKIDSFYTATLEPRYVVKKYKMFGLIGELEADLTRDYTLANYTWSKVDLKAREYGMKIYSHLVAKYGQPIDYEQVGEYVYFGWHVGTNTVGLSVTSSWVTYSAMPVLYAPLAYEQRDAREVTVQDYIDSLFRARDGNP